MSCWHVADARLGSVDATQLNELSSRTLSLLSSFCSLMAGFCNRKWYIKRARGWTWAEQRKMDDDDLKILEWFWEKTTEYYNLMQEQLPLVVKFEFTVVCVCI